MQLSFVAAGKKSGRFQDNIDIESFPREISRIALLQNLNLVAAHDDVFLVVTDFTVELAMDRVPFEEVGKRLRVGQIVNRANALDLFLRHRAQDVAADAPEAVDCVICHRSVEGVEELKR